jgi:hypothetical protein
MNLTNIIVVLTYFTLCFPGIQCQRCAQNGVFIIITIEWGIKKFIPGSGMVNKNHNVKFSIASIQILIAPNDTN